MTLGNGFNINALFMTNPFNMSANNSFGAFAAQTSDSIFSGLNFNSVNFNYPLDFATVMEDWNKNQAQMQELFTSILMQMSSMIQHIPVNNFRPYDYNKCYSATLDLNSVSKSNQDKIVELRPEMQEKTLQLIEYARNELHKEIKITSGYRTESEQAYLREKTPHLAAKKSAHCEGKAVDISIIGGSDEDYAKLGSYAKQIGMRWGGDFSVKERWHFDYNWR